MINIDPITGELKNEKYTFSPNLNLGYIQVTFLPNELELWISNKNWLSYRLKNLNDYIFILYFDNEVLKMIDISPVNEINGNELSILLEQLRGEHVYSWGKVELNDDRKANYKSIIIKYK